jgi:uncharacterized protein YdhG (YjbR/CyaY superfamily)
VTTAGSVDEYIAGFPPEVRIYLEEVRAAIHAGVGFDAEEKIRYEIAAVIIRPPYAIHFAGWKNHVGLYPVRRFDDDLEERVAPYRAQTDSLHFRYKDGMPTALITEISAAIAARHPG